MSDLIRLEILLLSAATLAACGGDNPASEIDMTTDAPVVTFTPGDDAAGAASPHSALTLDYRIIGKPVVGQPVAVELIVRSSFGSQPVSVSYRINDATAMTLAEAQPSEVTMAARTDAQDKCRARDNRTVARRTPVSECCVGGTLRRCIDVYRDRDSYPGERCATAANGDDTGADAVAESAAGQT